MVTYDPQVLYQFADRLYRQAAQAVVISVLAGVVLGAGAMYLAGIMILRQELQMFTFAGLAAGAGMGYISGSEKAARLRLQAQTALCQVKIEENTRLRDGA